MSTLYLIDPFTTPWGSSSNEPRIVDALLTTTTTTTVGSYWVVRVPDNVSVKDPVGVFAGLTTPLPSDPSGLLAKKYKGMLANYAGFANIVFDPMYDEAGLDLTRWTGGGSAGSRGQVYLSPGASVETVLAAVTTPSMFIANWEPTRYTVTDSIASDTLVSYIEESATNLTCEVSFQNGAVGSWMTALNGIPVTVPVAKQGTQLRVKFTNASTTATMWIGGWAVVY